MIDESILDKVIPLPDEEELEENIKLELEQEGFAINNFNSGGIFYTIIKICIRIHLELLKLSRTIINNLFIKHAEDDWLEIKAADFSKERKAAKKAQGWITIHRDNVENALSISKGHMFKTRPDTSGVELKYYVLETTIIPAGQVKGKVLVEAEKEGTTFNVSSGRIIVSMIHLDGVSNVINDIDWMYKEGTDIEDIESLRSRCMGSWSELAERTIKEKLKNVAEGVNGVMAARIDDQHPRGQGTVDVIITGTAGTATEELLNRVNTEIQYLKGNYEDYLVKSSETVIQDFELVIYLAEDSSKENVKEQAEQLIMNMMKIGKRELNKLYKDSIISVLSSNIIDYKKTDIIQPATDIELANDKVIILGNVSVTVRNVGTVI